MNTRKYSSRQEKYVAKKLGGRVQPNSGATPFLKGDIVMDNWLLECKTQMTDKKSITIKKEWLDKLEEERFAMRKQNMALVFNFGPGQENYYVINEKTFKQLEGEN
jgi:hypothetical protein